MNIRYIKFPGYRHDVRISFDKLADFEMQKKEWLKNSDKYPHTYCDNLLYYVLDSISNDYELHEYKTQNIGEIFYDEYEARMVQEFCKWFDELIEKIGENQPNSAYLDHPEWPKVFVGAKRLYDLMTENNKKYDFDECYAEFNKTPFPEWMKKFEE